MTIVGKPAPPITLPSTDGGTLSLTYGQGKYTALFFFPSAAPYSYGCTQEACQFRDAIAENPTFKNTKVRVVGISGDSVEKQKAFVQRNHLTYPILSDKQGEVGKAYEVRSGSFGSTHGRTTFIIDGKGIIRDRCDNGTSYSAHHKFVEEWLVKLEAEQDGE